MIARNLKVRLFEDNNIKNLQKEINSWLASNQHVSIVDRDVTYAGGSATYAFIAIWYREIR